MQPQIDRRTGLKLVTAGTLIGIGADAALNAHPSVAQEANSLNQQCPWSNTHDRVWIGGDYWANPMEDWSIVDGAAECHSAGGNRSIHHLTHQLTRPADGFAMSVHLSRIVDEGNDGGAGFRIGVRSELNEYRSNCFVMRGLDAGIIDNQLVLGSTRKPLGDVDYQSITLTLQGRSGGDGSSGDTVSLSLVAKDAARDQVLGEVTMQVEADRLLGNVSLVSNYTPENRRNAKASKSRYRFRDWVMSGNGFSVRVDQRFGPLLWTMYTLSDSRGDDGFVMKLSALTGPLGDKDNHDVELLVEDAGSWKSLGEATLDRDAWVATFRIPNWDATKATRYQVVYRESHVDGTATTDKWGGTILANPSGRPLRMAAMTCQNDYAFPYEPVANNVAKLKPDLAYFSGDQIYENHGGFGIIRDPADRAILNYLRKYYQFGWAFREVMRDCPTVCLPDDHDVFQGNLWGEAGAKMEGIENGASSKGGYREPARMVNAVHRTNVAHHPDAFDPTPVQQDISVYHGDMVYGGVSFAIIADRQWKSGPERVDTGSGRADHVLDPNFDCQKLDKPGLVLLGERQEDFLRQWAKDWRGHSIKVVLSQTVFAGVATHHGGYDGYLKGDLDCGSWPQTPRNRAVEILRESKALHINGDQHLTTLCQYGVHNQRDSVWSFCTPAIAVGYPRWWRPDEIEIPHTNRPKHGIANTGEYTDSFGNLVYVYAVGNPEVGTAPHRYEKAHQKGSGFGFVTIDPEAKTYKIESFRFLVDLDNLKPSDQFPGWPVTIDSAKPTGIGRVVQPRWG